MGDWLRPGDVLAGYTIEALIGEGGMGRIYRARHPRLPRAVAIKMLTPTHTTDPTFVTRFEREADHAARVEHPNVVTVYDRGVDDGRPWISMQFISGSDAAATVTAEGPLAVDRSVYIVSEIARGLDHAHTLGVLHRDVKPANIMLSPTSHGPERVLLTDFGIAKAVAEETGLTETGTIISSLPFAAPEVLYGRTLDGRTDQYALAATLYALLAGTPPFPGPNQAEIVAGHLSGQVPALAGRRRDVPAALDAVIARGMAKEPADRFPSCADFAAAARAAARPPSPAVRPTEVAPPIRPAASHPPVSPPPSTDRSAPYSQPNVRQGPPSQPVDPTFGHRSAPPGSRPPSPDPRSHPQGPWSQPPQGPRSQPPQGPRSQPPQGPRSQPAGPRTSSSGPRSQPQAPAAFAAGAVPYRSEPPAGAVPYRSEPPAGAVPYPSGQQVTGLPPAAEPVPFAAGAPQPHTHSANAPGPQVGAGSVPHAGDRSGPTREWTGSRSQLIGTPHDSPAPSPPPSGSNRGMLIGIAVAAVALLAAAGITAFLLLTAGADDQASGGGVSVTTTTSNAGSGSGPTTSTVPTTAGSPSAEEAIWAAASETRSEFADILPAAPLAVGYLNMACLATDTVDGPVYAQFESKFDCAARGGADFELFTYADPSGVEQYVTNLPTALPTPYTHVSDRGTRMNMYRFESPEGNWILVLFEDDPYRDNLIQFEMPGATFSQMIDWLVAAPL